MAAARAADGYLTMGQPAAVEAVRRQVRSGSPAPALLLAGPSQGGKTTVENGQVACPECNPAKGAAK